MTPGSITALVETLVAVNATPEQILAAVRTAEKAKDEAIEQSRAKARARVQKWRDNKAETLRDVTERSVAATKRLTRADPLPSTSTPSGNEGKKDTSPPARSRGSRIPDDFVPDIEAAVAEGLSRQTAEREARTFLDYWRARPGKEALKLDWPATWRIWFRKRLDVPSQRAQPPPKQTVGQQARDELRRMGMMPDVASTENRRDDESDRSPGFAGSGLARRFTIASSR